MLVGSEHVKKLIVSYQREKAILVKHLLTKKKLKLKVDRFKNPKYKDLSLGPKLMYSILRDRLDMSIKNNWKDKDRCEICYKKYNSVN